MVKKIGLAILLFFILLGTGCRSYDHSVDIGYFFKTGPEKAVLDFLQAMENHDPGYLYDQLLLNKDKNNISRDRYIEEFKGILSDVQQIEVSETVYLGYEANMSKVVAEFSVIYMNGDLKEYKKYIYLQEENGRWKIVFEKTFI
ncbi:MAG: NTF2-like N-terminal transpeptidase domain-containing protein [Actinomycetota bacterium]|nr:NTF2-like N-terminal transpeptidase domain-containing protein [Actinomycetota bacterium]